MTKEEKDRIDYEIKAKKDSFNNELLEWSIVIMVVALILFAIKILSILIFKM